MSRSEREIPQRELRNHLAKILEEVAAGTRLRVTVRGKPVAELVPVETGRRFVPRAEVSHILKNSPLDRRFPRDVAAATGTTIDDL